MMNDARPHQWENFSIWKFYLMAVLSKLWGNVFTATQFSHMFFLFCKLKVFEKSHWWACPVWNLISFSITCFSLFKSSHMENGFWWYGNLKYILPMFCWLSLVEIISTNNKIIIQCLNSIGFFFLEKKKQTTKQSHFNHLWTLEMLIGTNLWF